MTIKNGDLPAMPTIYADMATNGQREIYCDQTGLTKREQFAMAALQGLLSKYGTYSDASIDAVKCAEALLAQLELNK